MIKSLLFIRPHLLLIKPENILYVKKTLYELQRYCFDFRGLTHLPSTLPTLATTLLRARCTVRLRTGASGHVRRTPLRMLTTWASLSALSIRRTSTLAAAVTPYAAPRSRIDSTL